MARPPSLDVASLIRNLLDLSLKLKGPRNDADGAMSPFTLHFNDSRLELVYYSFLVGSWDAGGMLRMRTVLSFVAYYTLLFVVTFIVSTPGGIEFNAFAYPLYSWAFAAIVASDILFWVWHRSLRGSRDAAISASGRGDWGPLTRLLVMMNVINIAMCLFAACIVIFCENIETDEYPFAFGLTNLQRSALFFGAFGRLPARFAELMFGGTLAVVAYNAIGVAYTNLSWARTANVFVTSVVLNALFAAQLYYRERARRRTFHGNLVAASFRAEVSRLRDTSAALLFAQKPSFAVGHGTARIPAFQCTATVCCVYVQIGQVSRSSADSPVAIIKVGCNELQQEGCLELKSSDPTTNQTASSRLPGVEGISHARLLNAVFAVADELASVHGVDKVRTHATQWLGAGGLRDAAALHRLGTDSVASVAMPIKSIAAQANAVVSFAIDLQARVVLLLQEPEFADFSASLSIGISSERTVIGRLNTSDSEYQIVGDAVTEAQLLAVLFQKGTMVSECTLKLLESCDTTSSRRAGSNESTFSGFVWGVRIPMPSAGGNGVVSAFYRDCLRFSDTPIASALPPPSNGSAVSDNPDASLISSSHWASHAVESPDTSIAGQVTESKKQSSTNLHPEVIVTAADSVSKVPEPIDSSMNVKRRDVFSRWSAFLKSFTRDGSGDHIDRFLRVRGFTVSEAPLPVVVEHGDMETEIDSSLAQDGAVRTPSKGESVDSASSFAILHLESSSIILPTFFAGIFILELGGAIDIYGDTESSFVAVETELSLRVLPSQRNEASYRTQLCKSCRCHWPTGPRTNDNAYLLLSWGLVVAALTVQGYIREANRYEYCGRLARSSIWSVASGSGYVLTLIPIRSRDAMIVAIFFNTVWMTAAGIGYLLNPIENLYQDCPPTAPLWPRAVLLYGFLAYMIAARIQQDIVLSRMFALHQLLDAGRDQLGVQADKLLRVIRQTFPPHVLAICMNIAMEEREKGSLFQAYGSHNQLLEEHLKSVPKSKPIFSPSLLRYQCNVLPRDTLRVPEYIHSNHKNRDALVESDVLLQRVPNVCVLCVDLTALKNLSGLLHAGDTLAVLAFLVSALDACVNDCGGHRVHVIGTMYLAVFGLPTEGADQLSVLNRAYLYQDTNGHNNSTNNVDLQTSVKSDCTDVPTAQTLSEVDESKDHGVERSAAPFVMAVTDNRGPASLPSVQHVDVNLGVAWQALLAADAILQHLVDMNAQYGVAMTANIGIDTGDVWAGILGRRAVSYQVLGAPILSAERLALSRTAFEVVLSPRTLDTLCASLSRPSLSTKMRGLFEARSREASSAIASPPTESLYVMHWCDAASVTLHSLLLQPLPGKVRTQSLLVTDGRRTPSPIPSSDGPASKCLPSSDIFGVDQLSSRVPEVAQDTIISMPLLPNASDSLLSFRDFKLLRSLGSGQFAAVYLSLHIPSGNPFAIKVLDASSVRSRSIQAELKALTAPSRNPFLVEFICVVNAPGELWLVQEYIEGGTLEAILNIAGALSEKRTRLIVAELACAVGHIHSLGILHRDIKPANIMIHPDGHVRLIDLGLAALVKPPLFNSNNESALKSASERTLPEDQSQSRFNSFGSITVGSVKPGPQPPVADSTLVSLLQSLIPAPRNKVLQRIAGRNSSLSVTNSVEHAAAVPFAAPNSTGTLLGVVGSALLCCVNETDPLGLRSSEDVAERDLHSMLRFHGLFITSASTVSRALELLRRDVLSRIFDIVIVSVPAMRLLDAGLNLIEQARALPFSSTRKNDNKPPPKFVVFLSTEGMLFDASAARFRSVGADLIGHLPPSASFVRRVLDALHRDGRSASGQPPSPCGASSGEIGGCIPTASSLSSNDSPSSARVKVEEKDTIAAHEAPDNASHSQWQPPRSYTPSRLTPSNSSGERSSGERLRSDPTVAGSPSMGLGLGSKIISNRSFASSNRVHQPLPALASLSVAGALQDTVAVIAGTPSFMASEAIQRKAGLPSDWFSVGVVAFVCLAGRLPFDGMSRQKVHQSILGNRVRWDCLPAHVSPEARSLLQALLQPDPVRRLGTLGGVVEVLAHPFFQGWSQSSSAAVAPFTMEEHEILKLPLLSANLGLQQPISLSARLSRIERRLDPSQRQMLRNAGRNAASRLASSMGSATQSYCDIIDGDGDLSVEPTSEPSRGSPEHGSATYDTDALAILTAGIRLRPLAATESGRQHGLSKLPVPILNKTLSSAVSSSDGLDERSLAGKPSSFVLLPDASVQPPATATPPMLVHGQAQRNHSSFVFSAGGRAGGSNIRARPKIRPSGVPVSAPTPIPEDESLWDDASSEARGCGVLDTLLPRKRVLSSISERFSVSEGVSVSECSVALDGRGTTESGEREVPGEDESSRDESQDVVDETAPAVLSAQESLRGCAGKNSPSELNSWDEDERRVLAEMRDLELS